MIKIIKIFLKNYLKSPKKEWKSFDSLFLIFGIILSVCVLTTALGLFQGYEKNLKNTILDVNSHVYVFVNGSHDFKKDEVDEIYKKIEKIPSIKSKMKVVKSEIIAVNDDRVESAMIKGFDWQKTEVSETYRKYIVKGTWKLDEENSVIIGKTLAEKLNVKLGDEIDLINPINSKFSAIGLVSKKQKFKIIGLYSSGMHDYDSNFIITSEENAFKFKKYQEYSIIEIRLKEEWIDLADEVGFEIQDLIGSDYQVSSWIYFNGTLFSLLELEKWVIFIILTFLVIIASFNVISFVLTSIVEKKREIGIMLTFGTSKRYIKGIFLGRVILVSSFGIILGEILGFLIAKIIAWQSFLTLKADVYFIDKISVSLGFSYYLLIFFISFIIILITALIPVRNISKMNITDIIRS